MHYAAHYTGANALEAFDELVRLGADPLMRSLAGEDETMFQALRRLRLALARAQGVPPYVIFHDATLVEMARNRPLDERALAEIPGVASTKLSRYGDAFLAVLQGEDPETVADGF